jgi:hypothetical protein
LADPKDSSHQAYLWPRKGDNHSITFDIADDRAVLCLLIAFHRFEGHRELKQRIDGWGLR